MKGCSRSGHRPTLEHSLHAPSSSHIERAVGMFFIAFLLLFPASCHLHALSVQCESYVYVSRLLQVPPSHCTPTATSSPSESAEAGLEPEPVPAERRTTFQENAPSGTPRTPSRRATKATNASSRSKGFLSGVSLKRVVTSNLIPDKKVMAPPGFYQGLKAILLGSCRQFSVLQEMATNVPVNSDLQGSMPCSYSSLCL